MSTPSSGDDLDLRLGIPELDVEHEVQHGLLDALDRALRDYRSASECQAIAARFADYTRMHVVSEQLLMRFHSYPLYDEHVLEHGSLFAHVGDLEAEVEAGDVGRSAERLERVREWHVRHVRGLDRSLAIFLAADSPASGQPGPETATR